MPHALSLAVVGADYPNKRGPGRRFEIALCVPGEPIELRPEPKNPKDDLAIAVYSCRGVQMGYVTAERAPLVHTLMRRARAARIEPNAIFQAKTDWGAMIRVSFDGAPPVLPPAQDVADESGGTDSDAGFYPDWIPPDD